MKNDLKTNKIKDVVFDLDEILRFDGETGPYVQYTYVRTKSILNKANFDISNIDLEKIDYNLLKSEDEISLVKILDKFSDVIKKAYEESFNSSLSFGIALNDEKAAFHFSKLEEEKPLFLVNIKSMDKKDLRAYGSNAARLIKGIPFKEV